MEQKLEDAIAELTIETLEMKFQILENRIEDLSLDEMEIGVLRNYHIELAALIIAEIERRKND